MGSPAYDFGATALASALRRLRPLISSIGVGFVTSGPLACAARKNSRDSSVVQHQEPICQVSDHVGMDVLRQVKADGHPARPDHYRVVRP